jgi:hypothetical protein
MSKVREPRAGLSGCGVGWRSPDGADQIILTIRSPSQPAPTPLPPHPDVVEPSITFKLRGWSKYTSTRLQFFVGGSVWEGGGAGGAGGAGGGGRHIDSYTPPRSVEPPTERCARYLFLVHFIWDLLRVCSFSPPLSIEILVIETLSAYPLLRGGCRRPAVTDTPTCTLSLSCVDG